MQSIVNGDEDQSTVIANTENLLQFHERKMIELLNLRNSINNGPLSNLIHEVKNESVERFVYPAEMSVADISKEQQRKLRYAYDQFYIYINGDSLNSEIESQYLNKETYAYFINHMKMLFARYSRKVSDMGVLCKNSNPTGDFRKRYDQLVTYYKTLNLLYKKSNYAVKYYQIFSKQATKKSKKSPVVEWDVKLTAVNKFFKKVYTEMSVETLVERMSDKETLISIFDEDRFTHSPPKKIIFYIPYCQRKYQYAETSKKSGTEGIYSVKATRAYDLLRELVLDTVNIGQITLSLMEHNQYAIQDGQQRLRTIYNFVSNSMLVPSNIFQPVTSLSELRDKIKYEKPSRYFSDLPESEQRIFLDIKLSVCLIECDLKSTKIQDRLRILNHGFTKMNGGRLNLTVDEQKKAEIPREALLAIEDFIKNDSVIYKLKNHISDEKSELLSYVVRIIGLLNNRELKSTEDFLDNGINYLYKYCEDPELTELNYTLIALENALKVFNEYFEIFALIHSTRSSTNSLTFKKAYFETHWVSLTEELLNDPDLYIKLLDSRNFNLLKSRILHLKSDHQFISYCSEHTNSKAAIEDDDSGRFPLMRKLYEDVIHDINNPEYDTYSDDSLFNEIDDLSYISEEDNE